MWVAEPHRFEHAPEVWKHVAVAVLIAARNLGELVVEYVAANVEADDDITGRTEEMMQWARKSLNGGSAKLENGVLLGNSSIRLTFHWRGQKRGRRRRQSPAESAQRGLYPWDHETRAAPRPRQIPPAWADQVGPRRPPSSASSC